MSSIGLVNTHTFREAAIYFNRYGRYDDGTPGTLYHNQFWEEERRRCEHGYTSGGIYISGYNYHYLNHTRIIQVKETYKEVHDNKPKNARRVGVRQEDFPRFWDVDFAYFTSVNIAENGISPEDYELIPITLNINKNFLGGGYHVVWLKPRGVGASWKAASMAARNFGVLRDSKSYMLANDKTYLTEDGLWSKFLGIKDWQIEHALGIGKRSQFKNDRNNMHIRASIAIDNEERGYMSEVIGVALANDPQKARGKRGKLILYEELGKFPYADIAWDVNRESVEEGGIVFGLMLGFGTGGTKDANFKALKLMFYNPAQYNILAFDNVYSENVKQDELCAMFTQAYKSIAHTDKDGNSNTISAKAHFDARRKLADENKNDPTQSARTKAENPYTPEEAVLVTGNNIFISKGLEDHAKEIELSGLYRSFPTCGYFQRKPSPNIGEVGELEFIVDVHKIPVYEFPHKPSEDTTGAVLIYESPYRNNGIIPRDLYKICVDTFRHEDTTGDSIGSIFVIEQSNNFTRSRGDIIAATFHGRPKGAGAQEEFNTILFHLGEYYNAEIAFENDEPGDVVGYAKRHKKTYMLAEEFELAFDETLKSGSGASRSFGMKMASGKEDKRKKQGDLYIKYWLYTERGNINGKTIYNYHTIKDLGFLQELINYGEGNFDRISAFRVGMYHQRELLYNEVVPRNTGKRDSITKFFEKPLF